MAYAIIFICLVFIAVDVLPYIIRWCIEYDTSIAEALVNYALMIVEAWEELLDDFMHGNL